MERYHIYKLGIAILFYAVYCRRSMVNGLKVDDGVGSASTGEDYYVYYQGVQGKPGVDFPVHARIPRTGFNCKEVESGYYADLDTDCQVFHICNEGTKVSFLCPNGTIFQQSDLICDWWFKVNCTNSPNLYVESAEQLRESHIRRKASRRVYNNDEAGKFHKQFSQRKMDASEEMQVGAESAGFYGSGLNSIATTQKERNPYPNHRTTYSEVKHYTNLPAPTPASAAKSTINNGKPFVVSTPKLGVYTTERSTFRYSPTVPTIRPTVEAVYSTYRQGKTTFGVRSTPRVALETFTDPPSVANGRSTAPRKQKHKNSFTIGLNSLQGAVAVKAHATSTQSPRGPNKGVIRLNLSSDGGAKTLRNHGLDSARDNGFGSYNNAGQKNNAGFGSYDNTARSNPEGHSKTSNSETYGDGQSDAERFIPQTNDGIGSYTVGPSKTSNFGSKNYAGHTINAGQSNSGISHTSHTNSGQSNSNRAGSVRASNSNSRGYYDGNADEISTLNKGGSRTNAGQSNSGSYNTNIASSNSFGHSNSGLYDSNDDGSSNNGGGHDTRTETTSETSHSESSQTSHTNSNAGQSNSGSYNPNFASNSYPESAQSDGLGRYNNAGHHTHAGTTSGTSTNVSSRTSPTHTKARQSNSDSSNRNFASKNYAGSAKSDGYGHYNNAGHLTHAGTSTNVSSQTSQTNTNAVQSNSGGLNPNLASKNYAGSAQSDGNGRYNNAGYLIPAETSTTASSQTSHIHTNAEQSNSDSYNPNSASKNYAGGAQSDGHGRYNNTGHLPHAETTSRTSTTVTSQTSHTHTNAGQSNSDSYNNAGHFTHAGISTTVSSQTAHTHTNAGQSNSGSYNPNFASNNHAGNAQTDGFGSYTSNPGTSIIVSSQNNAGQSNGNNYNSNTELGSGNSGHYTTSGSSQSSPNSGLNTVGGVTTSGNSYANAKQSTLSTLDGDKTLDLGENANGFVSDAVLSLSAGLQPPVGHSNIDIGLSNIESHTVSYQVDNIQHGGGFSAVNNGKTPIPNTPGQNSNGKNDDTVIGDGFSALDINPHAIENAPGQSSNRKNVGNNFPTLLPPLQTSNTRAGKSYDGFFVTKTNTFRPEEFITADFNSGSITGSKNTYIPTTKQPPIYTSTTTEYVSNTFGFVKPTGVPKPKPFEPASTTERPVLTTAEPDYGDLYDLEYQISSASPFTNVPPTLPTSYCTNSYDSTRRPLNEHADNMLDTLREIADVKVNGAPRPGLLVPPSVGPQTLHTLAVYFANALDNLEPAQEAVTMVDEDLVINSLLSKKTVTGYNELFMREQDDDAVEQDENDLNSEHSSNAVQSPRVRQLAKVFTQALSSYLDDPDMFRKVLQQIRPTEPPPLRTLPTDNPEEDELLNYSDADIKPEAPRLPTPPPANPTWGYILAFNNSNSNHLDNSENLQTADTQSFVPGYNDIPAERTHWTQSPEVTKLWRNTLLVDPLTLNENLEKNERPVDYELHALPTLHLNSTQVHGLLINFMNTTDDSAKLKRILGKLNTTQDEFLEKMRQIEENPLTRRLILLLVSECASSNSSLDTMRDILSLAHPNTSGESLRASSTDWEAAALRSNLTLDRKPSAFTKLVDPDLKEEDQDARALQLLNSLYSIASKYGK